MYNEAKVNKQKNSMEITASLIIVNYWVAFLSKENKWNKQGRILEFVGSL